jgi:uncharacterized protein YfaS (alpha-2-macroglobulin family)
MKRTTVVTLLIAAVLAIGGLAYFALRPTPSLERTPQTATTTPPPPQTQANAPATPATPARTTPAATTPPVAATAPFAFRRLTIDGTRDLVEACFSFSQALNESGNVRYDDYVKLTPVTKPAIRVAGDRLCLGGLGFGRDYDVELLAGMPAADGKTLAVAETVKVSLGERPPLVTFTGSGLILPRETTAGVPITTVNVNTVRLKVLRVPDRIMARLAPEEFDEKRMRPYRIQEVLQDTGSLVWEGTMPVKGGQNETVTTAFPIREAVKTWKPGAYLVIAWNAADAAFDDNGNEESNYRYETASQWVVDSDIGLTVLTGNDGLHVFARALASAKPLANTTLTLIARNNEELARLTTDAQGYVMFAPGLLRGSGGNMPVAVMAYGANNADFNYLNLTKAGFDLSDRGVEGRAAPGATDAFVYLDRGIYRPGETVHVATMLRDRTAVALDAPLTLIVRRSDGVEYRRTTLGGASAGTVYFPVELSPSAKRGRWSVSAYIDPKAAPIGTAEFSVEDFVPQRLKLALTADKDKPLKIGDPVSVAVESRFLYGAPAAELDGEAEMKIVADPLAFPSLPGFRFGLTGEKVKEAIVPLEIGKTDAQGRTTAKGKIEQVQQGTLPLKANISVSIFEPGGRATRDEITLPVRPRESYVGMRPRFDGYVQESTPAEIEIALVDNTGKRLARPGVKWELVREVHSYQWYRTGNTWRWETFSRDVPVTSGTVDVEADKLAVVSTTQAWGRFRLTVTDPVTSSQTSVSYYSGWTSSQVSETPDMVKVTADKQTYKQGETARVRIEAPFAGEATIVIAGDRVFDKRLVQVAAEGTTVEIPVASDWGSGAYALVSAFRPLAQKNDRAPVRAIGLVWLGLDVSNRTLAVEIGSPEKITPRRKLEVPVKVAQAGSEAFVTLAAVDEGILQLTKFASPDPTKHYLGKRRLTVAIRDDYGRLLDGTADTVGQIRTGGDSAAGRGLEVVPTRTVALFSGIVKLDAQGQALIPLDIPDFTGELRLMAVAFDKNRVGQASKPLTVRDALVSDVTLPRFLAPNDESRLSLLLHNVEAAPGAYKVTLTASGAVTLPQKIDQSIDMPAGKRQLFGWPIKGNEIGIGKVDLTITGPNGFAVTRDWQIQVRPAQAPQTVELVAAVKPGADFTVDAASLDTFIPGSATVSVSMASTRGFDVPGLLTALDKYPFGCLEQTTSRALPLLYFGELAAMSGVKQDKALPERIQEAVSRILDMQRPDGSFGMWGAGNYSADPWIQMFALDFLIQAKAKDFVVPDAAVARALFWTRGALNEFGNEARAYGYYILARAGQADVGQLRYFQDTEFRNIRNGLGRGHLAAALALVGEKARALTAFEQSKQAVGTIIRGDYYGSSLRDTAGLTAVAALANQTDMLPDLTNRLRRFDKASIENTSTQEKAWMLLAAHAMTQSATPLTLQVNGKPVLPKREPAMFYPEPSTLPKEPLVIKNTTDREIWGTVSVRGIPKAMQPATQRGMRVDRVFRKLDGSNADLTKVTQNDRLMVVLTGRSLDKDYHEVALLDLLPAGWEIEAVIPHAPDGEQAYSWLPKISFTRTREARDDRFFASFSFGKPTYFGTYRGNYYYDEEETTEFALAYVVRAVTPGTYVLPPAQIEDMYRPGVIGRTAGGTITVLPRQ